ncbi:MAG TPA: hypothetical protein VG737_15775 [Cyclobacteriaceae bacterium]|nr:hypothetical protein [Cyclobacteriaceae bacterium]
MINEKVALIMLEGELPDSKAPGFDYTKELYCSMQKFADSSLALCDQGKTKKFESHLNLAFRLFKEGNKTVKNSIVNVYLYAISYALDRNEALRKITKGLFPKELAEEYQRLHLVGGL